MTTQETKPPELKALRLFMKGYSPQKVAALLHPGIGAAKLIPMQSEVWAEMRTAITWIVQRYDQVIKENRQLSQRNTRLEAENRRLRAQLVKAGRAGIIDRMKARRERRAA